jgi:hypothetical protein
MATKAKKQTPKPARKQAAPESIELLIERHSRLIRDELDLVSSALEALRADLKKTAAPAVTPAPVLTVTTTQQKITDMHPAPLAPSLADVRAALTAHANKHGMEAAGKVMTTLGYAKLSEIPEGAYGAAIKALSA